MGIYARPRGSDFKAMLGPSQEPSGNCFPDAILCFKNGLEDSLQFYSFPEVDAKKISSMNMPERMVREVRRRS
jgi:transposase-like protein